MDAKKQSEFFQDLASKLTDEQKKKLETCHSRKEFFSLLGEWDVELPDELLDAVAGGRYDDLHWWERTHETWTDAGCPNPYEYYLGLDWD